MDTTPPTHPATHFAGYAARLADALRQADWHPVSELADALHECRVTRQQVFLCGNGGSAANAMHIANDLVHGLSRGAGAGIRAHALPANGSVVTSLANDEGYERIFADQLRVLAERGDVLIALSGSGNSPNVLHALDAARAMGVKSYAVLGYDGGAARTRCDVAVHFAVDDMQISEDLQLAVAHMVVQWLRDRPSGTACDASMQAFRSP